MHNQTDEQSSRSEKWLKFSGNVECAWQLVKNASGRRAAEVFMETTEEHKVLRPIKRAKIHKSHTVTGKGPSHGKNWSYRASWRGGHVTKIRDAPAEKRRESKVERSSTRTEMLFLWCFSAPYCERHFSSFRSTLHNFKPYCAFLTCGIDHSYEARVKCKIGYDGGLITWISAKPTDWTPEVNYHISWKIAKKKKNSIMRRTSCSSLSRVLSTRSPCSTSPTSPTSFIAGLWKFCYVSSNNTKWEYDWTSTKRPVTNPVTGRRTSTERPVTAWIAMRKDVTGKEFTLTSWKTEIAKCRRARTTWTLCKWRTGGAIPRAAKFGRIDNSRAQSLNWDLWIGKQSPIRYRGAKFGSLNDPWWNTTSWSQLGSQKSFTLTIPRIRQKSVKLTMELLKRKRRHLTVQKDLGLLNSGMLNRGEVPFITVAVDQSTVKIGGNDENPPFKIKWDCWK